ncbi:MAG: hypothetical protein RSD40_04330 [Bacilli bacterium]
MVLKKLEKYEKNRLINGKYYDTVSIDILENKFTESYIIYI